MSSRLEPNRILHGDSREVLKTFPDASVDSVVTDPPAGLAFMAKEWDDPDTWKYPISSHGFTDGGDRVPAPAIGTSSRNPNCRKCRRHKRGWKDVPGCQCAEPDFDTTESRLADRDAFVGFLQGIMTECFRVLKPGGHALVWSIPRTSHWTARALEEAGFEIRDCVYHVFGQGFPKSLNVGKAIDKMAGATREVVGSYRVGGNALTPTSEKGGTYGVGAPNSPPGDLPITKPATPEAEQWDGWGTALKPAVECWWLCRKPIEAQNVASQVLKTGTGAINIDGTRIAGVPQIPSSIRSYRRFDDKGDEPDLVPPPPPNAAGRWPSNLVLTHSEGCQKVGEMNAPAPVINRFDDGMKPFGDGAGHSYTQSGGGTEVLPVYECVEGCPVLEMNRQGYEMGTHKAGSPQPPQEKWDMSTTAPSFGGGFSGPSGRRYGDDGGAARFFLNLEPEVPFYYTAKAAKSEKEEGLDESADGKRQNIHPTVKAISLMRYLVKMVTPKGGLVLDPFAGSGSTLIAAAQEGMKFIGIEQEEGYVKIAEKRVGVAAERAERSQAERDIFEQMMSLGDD